MSDFWPTPVAPGTVAPAHLDRVCELHFAVRKWLDDSAVAQKNEHLRANFPYVDLMFAFGLATLGEHRLANKLVEDARKVMEGPVPEEGNPQAQQAITAAVVRNFLFKALRYRIEQALAGKVLSGPLSAELLADREALATKAGSGPVNNPYKLAAFVIDNFRETSRIAEPSERVDPYASWTKHGDVMKKELAELHLVREPAVLAERIRKLYRDGVPGKPLKEVQFHVLYEGLPLAARVNEALVLELLAHVPAALNSGTGAATEANLPKKQAELLERALILAVHFNREDLVKNLVDTFTALVHSKPESARYALIDVVARSCVRTLKLIGWTTEIDRFLTTLYGEVLGGASAAELLKKHAFNPEAWAAVLRTLLNLAGAWLQLGLTERANPIVEDARGELLNTSSALSLQPKDYTELARAYVTALGQENPERCLTRTIELFKCMSPAKITNTWTTAQHYSRFHLLLVEDAVLAVCRLARDNPVPHIVSG
jgi:hypothetical protein